MSVFSWMNFCKSKKRIIKVFDPKAPLTLLDSVGLASMGCRPLVAHRRVAETEAIVSRISQDKAIYHGVVVTSTTEDGIADLGYEATIAGVRGAPITGSAASPFPTSTPQPNIFYTIASAPYASVLAGIPQDIQADPTSWDRFFALSMIGFGGTNGGRSGASTLLILPPDDREFQGSVFLRPYHRYQLTMTLPYIPSLQPVTLIYSATFGYYIFDQSIGFGFGTTGGGGEVEGWAYPCTPVLLTANGDSVGPSTNEANGPSLTREYNIFRDTEFTANGYGATATHNFDVPKSDLRGFLTVYADSSRVIDVSVSPGSLIGVSGVSLPAIGSGPPGPTPVLPGRNFDTCYQFDITGVEADYTFTVTAPGGSLTTSPAVLYDPGKGAHQRCFEAWVDAYAAGNPLLPWT